MGTVKSKSKSSLFNLYTRQFTPCG